MNNAEKTEGVSKKQQFKKKWIVFIVIATAILIPILINILHKASFVELDVIENEYIGVSNMVALRAGKTIAKEESIVYRRRYYKIKGTSIDEWIVGETITSLIGTEISWGVRRHINNSTNVLTDWTINKLQVVKISSGYETNRNNGKRTFEKTEILHEIDNSDNMTFITSYFRDEIDNAEAIPRETDISFTIRLHFEENEYLAYDLHFYLQNGSYIYYYEGEYRLVSEGVKSILDEALSGLVYDNETQKWQKK